MQGDIYNPGALAGWLVLGETLRPLGAGSPQSPCGWNGVWVLVGGTWSMVPPPWVLHLGGTGDTLPSPCCVTGVRLSVPISTFWRSFWNAVLCCIAGRWRGLGLLGWGGCCWGHAESKPAIALMANEAFHGPGDEEERGQQLEDAVTP